MSMTRRRILMGVTALTAAALTHRFAAYPSAVPPAAADEGAAMTGNVLVLHDGGPAGLAFARQLQQSARTGEVAERVVAVLTLLGFKQAGALLDGTGRTTLVALFDDAEIVVIEGLLKMRGAVQLEHRRRGRQVLLSARL